MTRYEVPELFEVGSVDGVVLGAKLQADLGDSSDSSISSVGSSVLDVD